jgi:hypothetical protein
MDELGATWFLAQLKNLTKEYVYSHSPHIEQLVSATAETPTQLNSTTELNMYVCPYHAVVFLTSAKGLNASSREPKPCLMYIY